MTTANAPKKPAPRDWHPADVIAAIRKKGWSLQQLAFAHGYSSRTALANALHKPYPKAEAIIAGTLGVPPQSIWPSRYNPDGTTNRTSGARPLRPANAQPSTALRANPKAVA